VLNEILGLQNKPKAVVHKVHELTGPKRKKKKKKQQQQQQQKKKKKKKKPGFILLQFVQT